MRKYRRITYEDRCQIYALNKRGSSQQGIAKLLGLSQSAVSRELRRGSVSLQMKHELLGAERHPQQMPLDEFAISLGDRVSSVCLQVAADGIGHHGFQFGRPHAADRDGRVLLKHWLRDVVGVAHAFLVGVGGGHAAALLVEHAPGQESLECRKFPWNCIPETFLRIRGMCISDMKD